MKFKLYLLFGGASGVLLQSFVFSQLITLSLLVLLNFCLTIYSEVRLQRFKFSFFPKITRLSLYLTVIGATSIIDFVWGRWVYFTSFSVSIFVLYELLQVCKICSQQGWLRRFPRFSYWVTHV